METDKNFTDILASLERMYPGQQVLNLKDSSTVLGHSVRTLYNTTSKKARKKFPILPVRIGRKPFFRIVDLARMLSDL